MLQRLSQILLPALAVVLIGRAAGAEPATTFERDVRPILKTYCFHCHGEEGKPKGKGKGKPNALPTDEADLKAGPAGSLPPTRGGLAK